MTLANIEGHVTGKATAEAARLAGKAKQEAERITAAARDQADADTARELEHLKNQLRAETTQAVGKRQADTRMQLLTLKSRILEDVFRKATDRLLHGEAYWNLIREQLRETAGLEGRIRGRAEHRDTLARMIGELNTGQEKKVPPLAEAPARILGGFVFEGRAYDLDFSLESQLASCREKVLSELMAKAFGE